MNTEKVKTPMTDGAESTFNADSTTTNNTFQQNLKNLPLEISASARFFKVGADKKPLTKDWSNTENQQLYSDISGIAGFDCSGHGNADDYCLLDFDHVLNDDGEFVNNNCGDFFAFTQSCLTAENGDNCYCEKSVSKRGLHILIKPTVGAFPKITNGRNGVLHFSDTPEKDSPKLEIFYKTGGRYCLLTGDVYNCRPNAPIIAGETADNFLQVILDQIQNQNDKQAQSVSQNQSTKSQSTKFDDNAEQPTEQERAIAMLEFIPCSQQTYSDWLAVGMVLKNNGNSLADFENWSATDSERYNVGECAEKWQSFNGSGVTIATLHKFAQWYGYSEKDFQRDWYEKHGLNKNAWQKFETQDNRADDTEQNSETFSADDNTQNNDSDSLKFDKDDISAQFYLPHTDLYNARRLAMFYGKRIRFLTDVGRWYTYQNNIWTDGGKDNSAILPYCAKLANVIEQNADNKNEIHLKLVNKWQKKSTYSNAIEVLKGIEQVRITEKDLNTHKHLLNCKNGVIDLQTGKLYPHDSNYLLTQCVNTVYNPKAQSDTVNKFLRDVLQDNETLKALLRYLGYSITGEISEEKALFIVGTGGNGKGTLTKLLTTILADYSCPFPIESVLVQKYNNKDGDGATPAFNLLQWRRLAISEEIPAERKLDYAVFKRLTGGDALPIRKLYQESTQISTPTHKMIFSGNHLPELDDAHDPGILRRWLQIRFDQDFTGSNCDTTLKQRLLADVSLSAMLNLLVQNAMEWYKGGLLVSDKMKVDRDNYLAENDYIAEFISEHCERGENLSVSRKDLLDALKDEYPIARTKTDQALTAAIKRVDGVVYKRGGQDGGYKFFGVSLRKQSR